MKYYRIELLIIITVLTLLLSAGCGRKNDCAKSLAELDYSIERRDTYYTTHSWEIDSVKALYSKLPAGEVRLKIQLLHDLFRRYGSFQGDSAQAIADREIALAAQTGDADMMMRAQTDKLNALISSANFTDAVDIVRTAPRAGSSPETLGDFYFMCVRLYSDMSNFTDGTFSDKNARISHAYADSVTSVLDPDSYKAHYASIFKTLDNLKLTEKIEIFSRLMLRADVDDSEKAMISSILGDLYFQSGDKTKALQYKAKSAVLDITQAKRENSSLRFLAEMMFQDGDYERAIKYINVALDDANFFNAPHRKAEIANVLPLIQSRRYDMVNSKRRSLLWFISGLGVLFVLLCVTLVFYIKAIRRLRSSNKLLGERSEQLQELNDKLSESMRIKEEYIGYGFYANSQYIKRMESLYRNVARKLKSRQYDELAASLRDSDIKREQEEMLRGFDAIFLSLYPSFVRQYESLFPEEEKQEAKDGRLTPEQRIFALMRLGIKSTDKIATFLNYSVNTVNTYKTRAKNRSRLANDKFEAAIMNIKSIA